MKTKVRKNDSPRMVIIKTIRNQYPQVSLAQAYRLATIAKRINDNDISNDVIKVFLDWLVTQ